MSNCSTHEKRGHHPATCLAKGMFGRDCPRCEEYREARQRRTYHIVRINCDCGSDIVARTSLRWMLGPRCPNCHHVVGCMDYAVMAKVRASGGLEALRLYDERLK